MPFTYNGIGTRYHGKRNVEIRPGRCRSCGRNVQLESYDTRLCFVILYVPIIPFGRKRILDFCPACRRHYVSDLDKWETARQLETSGAMDNYRSNATPENAIAAHQQLVGFHQVTEATEFQKTMLERFPDNAKIQAYLGSALDRLGRGEQSVEFYKRALELRPDLPEARVGLARWHMRNGRLDDARKSLDFLEKSGAGQLYSLEPLETLAHNYESRSQHREALQLFEALLRELPKIAEHPGFRKSVKQSEKALGEPRTILPKQSFSLKRWWQYSGRRGGPISSARGLIGLGAVAAIVILGFGISNEYIRHHRKIYLVNGYDAPATVEIAGAGTVRNFRGVRELALPEGHFHAVISGPVREEIDFDVRDGYFGRWSNHHLWLINVGGAAVLERTEATYAANNPPPAAISFHTGKTFEQFDNVDNIFTPLPEQIQLENGVPRTLVGLDLFKGDGSDIFRYYQEKREPGDALNFAEPWLRSHPEDDFMLRQYCQSAEKQNQRDRADRFLRAGLSNRPVRVEWHRSFQNLHDRPDDWPMLVLQYDRMLAAEPTNSTLLYLRGRVENDHDRATAYYKQAMDLDSQNPFPPYALAYGRICAADWTAARPLLARATELDPAETSFAAMYFDSRLMLGEAPQIEQEMREALKKNRSNFGAGLHLMEALAMQDKNDEVLKFANDFVRELQARYGAAGEPLINAVWYHAFYFTSNFQKMESQASADSSGEGKSALAVALLEQGRVDEAAKALPASSDADTKIMFYFAFAAAYHQAGNETASDQWRSRGMDLLEQGGREEAEAMTFLKRDSAPTRSEMAKLTVSPSFKALMLILCAQQYPQSRAELAGFAKQLTSGRGFPYHLVQRLASTQ